MSEASRLRERFGINNGRVMFPYKMKNMNWFFCTPENEEGQWFCYGDISEVDIPRLERLLDEGEWLTLGWKDLPAYKKDDHIFGNGGGIWLVLNKNGIWFSKDDRSTWNCQNPKCPAAGACGGQCAIDNFPAG